MCVGALVKNRKSADKPANKQHRNINIKYVFMGFNTSIQISGYQKKPAGVRLLQGTYKHRPDEGDPVEK